MNRSDRFVFVLAECFRQLEQGGDTGGVIDRTIENLIALQLGVLPEMIPVRAEDDVFIFQLRIGAVDSANDIPRLERANLLFDVKTGAHWQPVLMFARHQLDGTEILRSRRFFQLVVIESGIQRVISSPHRA